MELFFVVSGYTLHMLYAFYYAEGKAGYSDNDYFFLKIMDESRREQVKKLASHKTCDKAKKIAIYLT